MQFTVPKFIEREAKIIGPLTFKQFLIIGIAGGISLLLYFVLPRAQLIIVVIFLIGGALVLIFVKIQGRSILVLLKDSFMFFSSPKLYIWERKKLPPKFLKLKKEKKLKPKEKKERASGIVITGGKLREVSTQLETKTK
ncbi:PrgI family protein [Candidatus Parcubacteria bacterium]|nr:PrgI family protein [Candidatus Parcubacteria bacterium]